MRENSPTNPSIYLLAILLLATGCVPRPHRSAKSQFRPSPDQATDRAPAHFKILFKTTQGEVLVNVDRTWSPNGADRIYNLVKLGFFTDIAFFRVLKGYVAQCGIHGDPEISGRWREAFIPDDPQVGHSNARGTMAFANFGPGTRATQIFINLNNNPMFDSMGFTPFGKVIRGMMKVDHLYKDYGDGTPRGRGPEQEKIQAEGNAYLENEFPRLDYIVSAAIIEKIPDIHP